MTSEIKLHNPGDLKDIFETVVTFTVWSCAREKLTRRRSCYGGKRFSSCKRYHIVDSIFREGIKLYNTRGVKMLMHIFLPLTCVDICVECSLDEKEAGKKITHV